MTESQPSGGVGGGAAPPAARVARGTASRAVGELVAKAASVAFYVAIARELGDAQFGDFIFGLSLSQVILVVAGLGTDELITRDVARDHGQLRELFRNVVAVKGGMLVLLWAVMALLVVVAGYPSSTVAAILAIGAGVGVEYLTKTLYSVFQAYERMHFVAASMITQRTVTSAAGIAAAIAGAGLFPIALIFFAGSVIGLATAAVWLVRHIGWPGGHIDRSRWSAIVRVSFPLGLVTVLYLGLVRLDAALLGFLTNGESGNAEVGVYGAAHRLIEATMFVSVAFGAAMLPWLARQTDVGAGPHARGYEIGLKVVVAILLPIGAVFGILAADWIDLVYGPGYEGAITPLRWLAVMTVLFGVISFVGIVMIASDSPREFIRPAAIVLAQNVITNLILIPPLGATGAAISSVSSGILLAGWILWKTQRKLPEASTRRIWASPVLATVALCAVIPALGGLTVVSLASGAVVYCAAFLALERVSFPADFGLYLRAVRIRHPVPE